ncbi:MAG: glucose-6-phosphate isomerase [Magnetococcales bacterium]|nr:glucose-6-phosphate isomerase [Magnetococcales bacterium]NGZ05792.1 glucose-6-phosphate isomerase [Magnetococcales bacterium]
MNHLPLDLRNHNFPINDTPPDTLLHTLNNWHHHPETQPAFLQLLKTNEQLDLARTRAEQLQRKYNHLVVLGIGGSSLGGNMLVTTLTNPPRRVTFYENICPQQLESLYHHDWNQTAVLAISKSGSTPETLAQLLTLHAHLGHTLPERLTVITENPTSALGTMARHWNVPIIPHAPVGGRFSVLSVTGLLPAAFAGVDIQTLLKGATDMAARCLLPDPTANPALIQAMAQATLTNQGRNMSILFTYGSRLTTIATWFRQLWAESLGKTDNQGRKHGLTPVEAQGVVDQHSQLQLYLDGPEDKQFTLLFDPTLVQQGAIIPHEFAFLPAASPLAGRSIGELFTAEYLGTRDALLNRQQPLREFRLKATDPGALGALIVQLEMETTLVAACFGIPPFDQPAVEEGKINTRRRLESTAPGTLMEENA